MVGLPLSACIARDRGCVCAVNRSELTRENDSVERIHALTLQRSCAFGCALFYVCRSIGLRRCHTYYTFPRILPDSSFRFYDIDYDAGCLRKCQAVSKRSRFYVVQFRWFALLRFVSSMVRVFAYRGSAWFVGKFTVPIPLYIFGLIALR